MIINLLSYIISLYFISFHWIDISLIFIDPVGPRITVNFNNSICVIVVYIPPNLNGDVYEAFLENLSTHNVFLNNDSVVLLGDFLPRVLDIYSDRPLVFDRGAFSLLNSIYMFELVLSDDCLLPVDYHHPPLSITISVNFKGSWIFPRNYHMSLNFKKTNFPRMYFDFCDLDWTSIHNLCNVNDACTFSF